MSLSSFTATHLASLPTFDSGCAFQPFLPSDATITSAPWLTQDSNLPVPLTGFLDLTAVYATHNFTALFHAVYVRGLFQPLKNLSYEDPCSSRSQVLPCRWIYSDLLQSPPSALQLTFKTPSKTTSECKHPLIISAKISPHQLLVHVQELKRASPPSFSFINRLESLQRRPYGLDRRLRSFTPLVSPTPSYRNRKAASPMTLILFEA